MTNGNVVYQARALYALINGPSVWTDDNCSAPREGDRGTNKSNNTPLPPITDAVDKYQRYRLYPDPSDGNINIRQAAIDNNPVRAEVWNSQGKSMYQGDLLFSNGTKNLNMKGITPGLYILHLRDSYGDNYNLKFIVN